MKRLLYLLFVLALITACSNQAEEPAQPQMDPPRYEVHFRILDEDTGDNLLYVNTPYLPKNGAWALCGEQKYELSRYDQSDYNPRAPFRFERYTQDGGYRHRVVFDGFTIDKSFEENITIYWGDVLDFYTDVQVGAEVDCSGSEPQITQTLIVDGEPATCEQGEDWRVDLLFKEIEISDKSGPAVSITGSWEITDLEASLDNNPLTSYTPEEALLGICFLFDPPGTGNFSWDEVKMTFDAVLDRKTFSVSIPRIKVSERVSEETGSISYSFDQEISDGEMTIDEVMQTIRKMTVQGEMCRAYSQESEISPNKHAPQTDYHSDLTFHVECEECTFELKLNYLRVIGDRGYF